MEGTQEKKGLNISTRSFITAILVILALMILTYILTFLIPGGEYARTLDENGYTVIDTQTPFENTEGGIPLWKWLLSPILVLGADGSTTVIFVIIFLLILGGIFNSLEKSGVMKYMLGRIVDRFGHAKYMLMAAVMLFFMAMGAIVGSFEECVPFVPIVVALAVGLGWDPVTGVCMSLLAIGCGFASGVCNPFTVGIAQGLAGLPMFSGIWLRVVSFALIYTLLLMFVRTRAKSIEMNAAGEVQNDFVPDAGMDKALVLFGTILGAGMLLVLSSSFLTFLQDYTMVIVAVVFLGAGISAATVSGMSFKRLCVTFGNGVVSILPAVFMILMASSIKYTLEQAKILDTILHSAVGAAAVLPKWTVILFIYLIVLVMNFFIPSGSAKAFLLMPLLVPMAQIFNVSLQLTVLAFAFGDGFSNVFYPTNPVLLISLGLADVNYGKWFRSTWTFQLMNFILTSLILLFGMAVGYC